MITSDKELQVALDRLERFRHQVADSTAKPAGLADPKRTPEAFVREWVGRVRRSIKPAPWRRRIGKNPIPS